jgi:uncharacterized surface protein with fasciclin (FAS1) repeats
MSVMKIFLAIAIFVFAGCNGNPKQQEPVIKKNSVVDGKKIDTSKGVLENIKTVARLSILSKAINATGVLNNLSEDGPITLFAPDDSAFAKLPKGALEHLLKPTMKYSFSNILNYHIVKGEVFSSDLKEGQVLKTIEGKDLTITVKNGKIKINNANVTITDIYTSNAVIHIIDAVLIPNKGTRSL